jgi:hypothetical protein
MKEMRGDIMQCALQSGITLIPTNCEVDREGFAIMGGGVARLFADKYPELPEVLGKKLMRSDAFTGRQPKRLSLSSDSNGKPIEIWAFPTKIEISHPSDLELIVHGIGCINAEYALRFASVPVPIYTTRLGCGLGGLQWEDVQVPMRKYCGDNWVVVSPN